EPAGVVALQLVGGETRLAWKDGKGSLTRAGRALDGTVEFVNGGMEAAVRWADLGLGKGEPGTAMPLSVGWGLNGPTRWLPESPVYVNALQWGAIYLNRDKSAEECAPTLTKPFVLRWDPTGVQAVLS